jgi:uncharacterized membrane protein
MNRLISNTIFFIQVLLLFLLIFESKIDLPALGQVFGRMHPLVVHLPIGLIFLLGILPLFKLDTQPEIQKAIVYLSALFLSLSALFGLFLSLDGGFEDSLQWHKWSGIGLSVLGWTFVSFYDRLLLNKKIYYGAVYSSLLGVLAVGHFGGELTHGENYLFAPLKKEAPLVITENTKVFDAAIVPILKEKCYSCHNEKKSKGELILTSLDHIMAGGSEGPVWVPGNLEESHLVRRINLPLEDEYHMPPKGKSQLDEDQMSTLKLWIEEGANTTILLADLAEDHPFKKLISATETIASYNFEKASPKVIEELNTPFRSVTPISRESPALQAAIFVREYFDLNHIKELQVIQNQLVSLNLTNLPVEDKDLQLLANFVNLEKLVLNGTSITTEGLKNIPTSNKIKVLAVSNTKIDGKIKDILSSWTSLEEVYVWNTLIKKEELDAMEKQFKSIRIHRGFVPNPEEVLPLGMPVVVNKQNVVGRDEKIQMKHNLPGAVIRYTMDGSEPDSTSPIYEDPFLIDNYGQIKARAFLEGWQTSSTAYFSFFKAGLKADSVSLEYTPNPQYQGDGAKTLNNQVKGDPLNFRNGAWLGYRDTPFSAYFSFSNVSTPPKQVVVSYLSEMGSYIMPPVYVEMYGGKNARELKLLDKVVLPQPKGYEPNSIRALELKIPSGDYPWIKVVAERVQKLPPWHVGAGDKGWVFIDEIFFYP